ncbi:MAG: carotenoid oxygenase family protein [Robiginitomaculum sp.]|nr:carotenoid oxygenase family protein [Robiginitomaculum sp.]
MDMHFSRRQALQTIGGGAALGVLAGCGVKAGALSVSDSYAKSAKKHPWTLGWRSTPARDLATPDMKLVSGKMPKGLSGTFYRNGPALFERDGIRLEHWFDGDGMVHAYNIDDGNVSHTGRMVRTGKYEREEKAGQFMVSAFGTKIENPAPITGPDDVNTANTSVLPIGGELLALWEGGSAYRLDDTTLETIGSKTWAAELKGMPFSAHPKIETDGSVWNFGQDVFGKRMLIYKISASGKLTGMHLMKNVPGGMIHDFCMTKKHLIFVVPSFQAVQKSDTFIGMFKWLPQESQRVIVVEKDNLDNRREFELPPGFQFHYGNAWEDKSGDIRFSACTGDSGFIEKGARAVMRGETFNTTPVQLAHMVLRKNGNAEISSALSDRATHEFPQFNARVQGTNARYLYTVGDNHKNQVGQMSMLKHDLESGKITSHNYGTHSIVEEHLFIPRPGGIREDDGWLTGTSLNLKTKATRLNILNAARLEDGPLAVLELPYALPLGFHGAWKGA